ncbi:MAG: hypothetical protein ACK562_13165 [Acidobacteriota bacterium]
MIELWLFNNTAQRLAKPVFLVYYSEEGDLDPDAELVPQVFASPHTICRFAASSPH